MMDLAVPLQQGQIEAASRLHGRLKQWAVTDRALLALHERFRGFDEEASLLKVAAINQLYFTNVYAVVRMAKHVTQVMAGSVETLAEAELVRRLAALPKAPTQQSARNHRSFASKFAHFFIDAERFPIFDDYAMRMVKLHLGQKGQVSGEPNEYKAFLENLHRLKERSGVTCSFRDLDRYLWLAGLYRAWKKAPHAQINVEVAELLASPSAEVAADLEALFPATFDKASQEEQ